jgi:hypothetical protein
MKNSSEINKILYLFIYLFDDKKKNDCIIHIKKHIYIHIKLNIQFIYNIRLKNELGYLLKMNKQIDLTQLHI